MKLLRLTLAGMILFSAAQSRADDWSRHMFQRLVAHPAFATTLYKEAALIMEHRGEFFAAVAVVRSEASSLTCAYAAPFAATLGLEPGDYVLKPTYLCDSNAALQAYRGYFHVRYPKCSGEVCGHPAIGVGNLAIRPDQDFTRDKLPLLLPVQVRGDFDFPYDPTLPVAGVPNFGN